MPQLQGPAKKLVSQGLIQKSSRGSVRAYLSEHVSDKVLFTKRDNDVRPYLVVKILDLNVLGLLDSGAACSVLGKGAHHTFLDLGFELKGINPDLAAYFCQ